MLNITKSMAHTIFLIPKFVRPSTRFAEHPFRLRSNMFLTPHAFSIKHRECLMLDVILLIHTFGTNKIGYSFKHFLLEMRSWLLCSTRFASYSLIHLSISPRLTFVSQQEQNHNSMVFSGSTTSHFLHISLMFSTFFYTVVKTHGCLILIHHYPW